MQYFKEGRSVDYSRVWAFVDAEPSSKEVVVSVDAEGVHPPEKIIMRGPGHYDYYYYPQ